MNLNPDLFLQHGILGGFVLVMCFGITTMFRLLHRLIDTLHDNSKDQVGALISVENAVKESIDKAEDRHNETLSVLMKSATMATENYEILKRWPEICRNYQPCGNTTNGSSRKVDAP